MRGTMIGTIAVAAFIGAVGGLLAGLGALAAMGWLLLVLRPVEGGALVATMSRRRFE
jgi:hypothetical protein